jgi:hypothetical protein
LTIGSIFIPLSLSGTPFVFQDQFQTIAIALSSITLIRIRFFISNRLSQLTERDRKVYGLIEAVLLKRKILESKGIAEMFENEKVKSNSIQRLRQSIALVITVVWLAVLVLVMRM